MVEISSFIFDKQKRKIIQRTHKRLKFPTQPEMEIDLETPIINGTNKYPTLVSSTNLATAMATKFNIQQLNDFLGKARDKTNLLEYWILEAKMERMELQHGYDALVVEKETLVILAKHI